MSFPVSVTASSPAMPSRRDSKAKAASRKPLRLAFALGAVAAVLGTGLATHLASRSVPDSDQTAVASALSRSYRVVAAPFVPRVASADTKSSRLARPAKQASALPAKPAAASGAGIARMGGGSRAATLGMPQRLFAPAATGTMSFQPSAAFRVAMTESRRIALALPAPAPVQTATAQPVASVAVAAAESAARPSAGEAPTQLAMLEPSPLTAAKPPEAMLGADMAGIPVPRARPRHRMKDPAATLAGGAPDRAAPRGISPARVALASVAPGRDTPARRNIAAPVLAYARPDAGDDAPAASPSPVRPGRGVAVYDISAATVYMPNGEKLEAHSGLGSMRDDPSFAHKKMRGPTPPHTYTLALRESLFHGVRAIRLHPVGGQKAIHNRNGLLAHTYMLGKGGDSNGCVSFKDYKRFLAAFDRGEVQKLVVVARMSNNPISRFASIFR